MAGILISGPAGAGKSQAARKMQENSALPSLVVDFQSIYASLLLLERDSDGRYPERQGRDSYLLPMAEYVRRVTISAALTRELFVVATNSDGSRVRRGFLLDLLGPGAVEQIIDPGREVVVRRLSTSGSLTEQCAQAVNRWYGGLNA